MLIKNKDKFILGSVLMIGFFGVLILMFLPIYGPNKENFLSLSDNIFNRLAKGSAYFIPKLQKDVQKYLGITFNLEINPRKPEDTPADTQRRIHFIKLLYEKQGASVEINEHTVKISGDLGQVLTSALEDADNMYWNKGEFIRNKYEVQDEKGLFRQWHFTLGQLQKDYILKKKTEEAKIINSVLTKAIEPAYNFYKIEPQKLSEQAWLVLGLLLFYIIYTIWFGYSILLLFEGFGLSTKKAKIKKEV